MAGSGGPWGGGGSGGDDDDRKGGRGGRRPGEGGQIPEIDEIMKKGAEQLKVLMGGRGGGPRGPVNGGGGLPSGPKLTGGTLGLAALAAIGLWSFASFYTVKPEEQSVELFLGKFSAIGEPGLNFAPWPFVTANVVPVTPERTEDIGVGRGGSDSGLMLTGDENIVDIDFQVVWNINDPTEYLFNLRDPELTINAVAESSMREIIAQSQLAPILNRDRGIIAERLKDLIQTTLDSYDSGLNIVRVNFDRADPPREVIDAFKNVQSAEQQRDRLQKEADAYANTVLAGARGQAAQLLEEAEGYRAQVVNQAEGEASRFSAVLAEYAKAPEVTRKRLYLETMEEVMGRVDKVIIDENQGGQGVVPYLPLNELGKKPASTGGNN
ncbi:FtsH protease activity modulator HflK [Defluviimonas aestuarii]|uniref:FtsH protease activity modulator HflK n=1 Tax=Albidovulum aestuarii TaxID=1130726 RepID=UPI002499F142|nr:FtsH protease activity modulator HflK [Defluviimonas aestuarii]MDI3335236.1 FtsH protease activity modulator HflK [Defluviimonas aestuarii]